MIQNINYNVNMETKRNLNDKISSLESELVMLRFGMVHILAEINETLKGIEQWQRWQVDHVDINEMRSIRDGIADHFNDSEFRNLCFDLGIDYDTLSGENLADRARELILHQQRRQRLHDLIERCKLLRPSTTWPDVL